jgi:hypothetical protein
MVHFRSEINVGGIVWIVVCIIDVFIQAVERLIVALFLNFLR